MLFKEIYFDIDFYGGSVGIALTQAIALLGRIQWAVKQFTALENLMVPVERILQYTHLPQEDTLPCTTGKI